MRVTREQSLPEAAFALCSTASGPALGCPANAVDVEAPETGRLALHGHG